MPRRKNLIHLVTYSIGVDFTNLPEVKSALERHADALVRRWVVSGLRKAAGRAARRLKDVLKKHKRTGQLGKVSGYVVRVYRKGKNLFCQVSARRAMWAQFEGLGTVRPTAYLHLVERGRKAVRAGTGKVQKRALSMLVKVRLKSLRGRRKGGGRGKYDTKFKPGTSISVTRKRGGELVTKFGKATAPGAANRIYAARARAAPGYGVLISGKSDFERDAVKLVTAAVIEGAARADKGTPPGADKVVEGPDGG